MGKKKNAPRDKERDLQRWDGGGGSDLEELEGSSSPTPQSGGSATQESNTTPKTVGNWCQFTANEKQFNVQSTYDANLTAYTTDLSQLNISEEQRRRAEQIAKEVEGSRASGGAQHELERHENWSSGQGANVLSAVGGEGEMFSDVQRQGWKKSKQQVQAKKAPAPFVEDDDSDDEPVVN